MKDPMWINLKTQDEMRTEGWAAESRDADGHLISCHIAFDADDASIVNWVAECTAAGETVTFFPKSGWVVPK